MVPEQQYYVGVNGQTYGPYPASQIQEMLASGNVYPATPLCPEGSQTWTTVGQYFGIAAGPPQMPGRPAQASYPRPPRPPEPKSGILKGVRIGTLLAALGLFFLPWLEVQCKGKVLIYQTGVDTIIREASLGKDMESLPGVEKGKKLDAKNEGAPETAWLVAGTALLILIALVLCLANASIASGIAALLAAAALGTQLALTFPVEKKFREEIDKKTKSEAALKSGAGADKSPAETKMEDAMAREAAKSLSKLEFKYSPWLWTEFGLFGLCFILSVSRPSRR